MAATRLTNIIRQDLLKQLLKRAFQERTQDLIDRCSHFALKVYDDAFAKDLEQINALPDGWLPTDNYICVVFGTEYTQLRFNGSFDHWNIGSSFVLVGAKEVEIDQQRFPKSKKNKCVKDYGATHLFTQEFQGLQSERNELIEEIQRAERTAEATLKAVTTIKKLIEVWPEVEEFAKPYLNDRAALPSIPREQLNNIFHLPPEEQSA